MSQQEQIKLFEERKVRSVWDDETEKWYFSIVDVVQVLTEQSDFQAARNYWKVLKNRLRAEGNESVTNCNQLKMVSPGDGKKYLTDVADTEQLLRLIQSVPSKKAEPFKQWLAQVGRERLAQMQDPERSIEQAIADYRRLGYSETWINQRIKTIEIRKKLTDEWKRGGITEDVEYAQLTDFMSKIWSGMTTKEYKQFKGLRSESLRDNMTDVELMLNGLAEASATALSKEQNPKGMLENANIAGKGAKIAKNARVELEMELGHSVLSSEHALGHINPADELPFHDSPKIEDNENATF